VDAITRSDWAWLLDIQSKLYQWSKANPEEPYRDLFNWICDPRNLRVALRRVAKNKGRNTPGVDGMTMARMRREIGEETFLTTLRRRLRAREYNPSPVRRKWIPKPGKPGKFRGLGIPTIEDRVVQSAIKQIMEPIFEARFLQVSHGFRPGHAVRDAVEHIRMYLRRRYRDERGKSQKSHYQWVLEGDIKNCFDQIGHHALMERLRKGVTDRRVTRLINRFLKAGIMEDLKFSWTWRGTPQGGILSPLLSNIALSVIEERYRRWVHPYPSKNPYSLARHNRYKDSEKGRPVFVPIRYADDFILLCIGRKEQIKAEQRELEILLNRELGLTLSKEKTKITKITDGFDFLGHRIQLRWNPQFGWARCALVPPDRKTAFRHKVKAITRNTEHWPLEWVLKRLNPIIRGWGNFYRHNTWAWKTFNRLDYYVFLRLVRWLKKKHPKATRRFLRGRYYRRGGTTQALRWCDGSTYCEKLVDIKRGRWDMKKRKKPLYQVHQRAGYITKGVRPVREGSTRRPPMITRYGAGC